MSAFTKMRLQ